MSTRAPSRLRFAFVVPRYGDDILGGGEAHARAVVEKLVARGHEVRVLTTTARSYKTWRSELAPGRCEVAGVPVERFAPIGPRLHPLDDALAFACTLGREGERGLSRLRRVDRSAPLALARAAVERAWVLAQGPVSPALVRAVEACDADLVVFFGYLYHPTLAGLPRVAARSALVPLADEEPMLYTAIVRAAAGATRALVVNTDEEALRLRALLGPGHPPIAVVALGIDPPPPPAPWKRPTDAPYLLVLGRAGKTRPMAPLWRAIVARSAGKTLALDDGREVDASELRLVTAGEVSPHLEGLPRVLQLGQVDDATRWGLCRETLAMVSSSTSESLSLVVLEGWLAERFAVVNARCDATNGHVERSRGGVALDFDDPERAADVLLERLASADERKAAALRGRAYVERRYAWGPVLDAYEALARALRERRDPREDLAAWAARTGAFYEGGGR